MATTIKLSDDMISQAKRYGAIYSRSTPKQIEYWAHIGKIAEENPELSYNFIKDILLAKAELADKLVTPYEFG
ncbi:MAG: ParD-like family protein [Emcibacter sp.]|nr:ParD-like family protein [Emcibacter sp.]